MQVTFGEEGSLVSREVVFFFLRIWNIELLDFDLPLLLFPAFVLKNLINGGGNLSILAGLEMGLVVDSFMVCLTVGGERKEKI